MDTYNLIAGWLGWPIVVALLLLAGGYGYWVLNNRIDSLKEQKDYLELKLSEADKYSADTLVKRLASRLKIISAELERLHYDDRNNNHRITELEKERDQLTQLLAHDLRHMLQSLLSDIEHLKYISESGNGNDLRSHLSEIEEYIVRLGSSLGGSIPGKPQAATFINQVASLTRTRVLIVEDDERLLGSLATLFSDNGVGQVDMAGCIEEAFHLLNDSKHKYDLVILDMMLPDTRKDLEAIRAGEVQSAEIREILANAENPDGSVDESQIRNARSKRTTLHRNIDNHLLKEGALILLERWQQARSKKAKLPHIIFLTARGDHELIAHGRKLAGKGSAWLVKPVTDKTIIEKAVEVLSNNQST